MTLRYLFSVGYNCGAAYQIRLHTGISEAYFFDWLYTSPAACRYLMETDFADFMSYDRLEIVRNGTEVWVNPSGIRLNHSFKPEGKRVSAQAMRSEFEDEKAKFEHLGSKMRAAFDSGLKIGFVRYNPFRDRPDSSSQIGEMAGAIRNRLRHDRFVILWIRNSGATAKSVISPFVTAYDIDERPERSTSNKGRSFINTDDFAWGEVFSTLDLDLVSRTGARAQLFPAAAP